MTTQHLFPQAGRPADSKGKFSFAESPDSAPPAAKPPDKPFAAVIDQTLAPNTPTQHSLKRDADRFDDSDQVSRRHRQVGASPDDADAPASAYEEISPAHTPAATDDAEVTAPPANADNTATEETDLISDYDWELNAAGGASASQGSNIIPFPTPRVIIPFPAAQVPSSADGSVEGDPVVADETGAGPVDKAALTSSLRNLPAQNLPAAAASQTATAALKPGDATPGADGEGKVDVAKLGLTPQLPSNVKAVAFQQPQPTTPAIDPADKIVQVAFRSGEPNAPTSAKPIPERPLSQLPGTADGGEESAQLPKQGASSDWSLGQRGEGKKAPPSMVLDRLAQGQAAASDATGITAARHNRSMDSSEHSKHGPTLTGSDAALLEEEQAPGANPARTLKTGTPDGSSSIKHANGGEWSQGRIVSDSARPVAATPGANNLNSLASAERISQLLVRESSLLRSHRSDSMSVVLRPDSKTELVVHLAQREGRIEATVRCECGDVRHLGALWPQLQESLAAQKVRLAPLQESPNATSDSNSTANSDPGNGQQRSDRDDAGENESLDDWPASSSSPPQHVRGNGGSRRRLTTSRPGWETWA
jgi:hypothetical protein